jgi:hypothetical protein
MPQIEHEGVLEDFRLTPAIKVGEGELESRGGHGLELVQITVQGDDGRIQRFYVKLTKTKSQIKCSVSAVRLNLPQDTTKSVCGAWFWPTVTHPPV